MMSLFGRTIARFSARQFISGWLLLALPAFGVVEATLDQSSISLGDSVTLTVSVSGGSVTSEPTLTPIQNLQIRANAEETATTIANGRIDRKTIYTFVLTPAVIGTYDIPGIRAGVDGRSQSSQALRLTVTRGQSSAPGSGPAFVEIAAPKTNLFFGEVMPVQIKCYVKAPANIDQPNVPADGFSVSQMVNPNVRNPPREMVGGVQYFVFVFRVAITPNKTGPLTLGPAGWDLNVVAGQVDFWGQARQQHIHVASPAVTIDVVPVTVPADVVGFTGAVGDFTLTNYDAGPTKVSAGDPITLKVSIAGRGGFDNVILATNQPGWGDFKMYQPTARFDSSDPLQVTGSKYFEQVVSPQNASIKEIPAFTFTFFDPEQKAFRTLTHGPIPISVAPVAATPQPTIISTGAPPVEEQQTREIVHIKPFFGRGLADRPPLILEGWFLALQAVPPLAWIGLVIWRRQKENLANNPRLRRQREVARVVQSGLAELPRLAAANDYEGFYAMVFRLLQEQLGERLDLPANAITEAALENLPAPEMDSTVNKNLQELFQACNQFRYTPEHTAQEMNSVIAKLKEALGALQQMKARAAARKATAAVGCLAFFILTMSARAQAGVDAFTQANKLYEEGKYSAAEIAYGKLIDGHERSVAVYYNLGNAAFKAGHIGRAIEAYRIAENYDPHDPDIRANLQFARDQVGNFTAALPGTRWTRWVGRWTLDQWAVGASITAALFFLTLIMRQLRPRQKNGWAGPVALALIAICFLICLALAGNQRLAQTSAVVISPEAVVRRGPLQESESAFTLHDGSEILVLNAAGPWVEVADASDHTGWVSQKDLAFIP